MFCQGFRASLVFKPGRVFKGRLQISKSFSSLPQLEDTSSSAEPYERKYQPSFLEEVENVEDYRPRGLHPVSIGDTFANGRYKVLHKLGFGGTSTVWLTRDQLCPNTTNAPGRLVTLKIMAAYMSGRELNVTPELVVPQKLGHPAQHNVQLIKDHFMEKGPNGMHLCLVSQFEGPSVLSMYEFLGMSFKTRIRSELARKVAKQAATVIERMHAAGFVHGDITTSNLLFKISDDAQRWSDREVYTMLGQPVTEVVVTRNGGPPEPCAPRELVEAVDVSCLMLSSLLQESIVVTDFGQSFSVDRIPKDYVPATVLYCTPPEVFFDSEISFASDVWMLACTIFGTRAGYSLFDSLLHSDEIIWMQIVETLGKLPEPWWSAFAPRKQWFEDNGEPKPEDVQKREGALLIAAKSSIREKLRQIGEEEGPPGRGDSWISEATCTKLDEAEVELLGDLLEKMLRYRPEDRVTMREVIEHPWFQY